MWQTICHLKSGFGFVRTNSCKYKLTEGGAAEELPGEAVLLLSVG